MNLNRSLCVLTLLTAALLTDRPACAVDEAVKQAQQQRIAVIEAVAPSVVAVFGQGGAGGGSGVLISLDGYALTNFHVTSVSGPFMKCGLNDGVLYDAVIVGVDPTGDVALIKLLGRDDFPAAPLGDSDTVQVGDWIYAMGNPFLLATDFQPTVTYGIVSGIHRYQYPAGTFLEYTDCIQVDASINPGNSGGPLFDAAGRLIGINGRISVQSRGKVNAGAGYAVSINQIKHFLDCLRSGRIVDHGALGATAMTAVDGSVIIDSILENSEIYRRGLRQGDEIVSFAGRPIRSVNQFKNILGVYPKGWHLPLVYRRDDQKHNVLVRLRGLHRKSEMTPKRRSALRGPMPDGPNPKPPKDDKKPRKLPIPLPSHEPPKPPEQYKHLHVQKEGFANYYFNKLEQERVLRSLDKLGDFSSVTGPWAIVGKTDDSDPFQLTLSEKGLALEIGEKVYLQLLDGSDLADEPPGTGGLLVTLHHLKMLLTKGEQGFSEFYYVGSEPLDGHGETVDVITSVLTGVESHWYFSRRQSLFLGVDTWLNEYADPCQVRFNSLGTFQTRKFPNRLTVRHGDRDFATFQIERFGARR